VCCSPVCWVAAVRLGLSLCVVVSYGTRPFSMRVFRFAHDAFHHVAPPLVGTRHLLWPDGGGIRQAPIGEAAGDLRNLPSPILHTECELKEPLIVVPLPVGPNGRARSPMSHSHRPPDNGQL
jgi:hypothetical protein